MIKAALSNLSREKFNAGRGVVCCCSGVSVLLLCSWLRGGLLVAAAVPGHPWMKTTLVSACWLGSSCSTYCVGQLSSQPWNIPLSCAPVASGNSSWKTSPRDIGSTWVPCKLCWGSTRRQTELGSEWTHWGPAGIFLELSTLWGQWSPLLVSINFIQSSIQLHFFRMFLQDTKSKTVLFV